jgi:glutathione S-transferase
MSTPALKLLYFPLPGRAEVTRLVLTYGGIPFTDQHVTEKDWPDLKGKLPFGQVPVLEVDGKQLAQSAAIERYVAKLAGLHPTDPWQAAKVDEAVAFVQVLVDLCSRNPRNLTAAGKIFT